MKSPITTTLLSYASNMMQEQLLTLKQLPTKPDESKRLSLLMSLGFDGTKEVQAFKAKMAKYSKAIEENTAAKENVAKYNEYLRKAFEILITARKDFGPDTIIINFENFHKLMRKYNLVCGLFSDYKGEIPQDKLEEISRLPKKIPEYIRFLYQFDSIDFQDDNLLFHVYPSNLIRFPFIIVSRNLHTYNANYIEGIDYLGNRFGRYNNMGYGIFGRNLTSATNLFICAPARKMKNSTIRININMHKDPFICAYTDYGILVFTRWGEEASSGIVKKYEELNRQIDKRAKELNIKL